jgi:excisionase family DNA binding protein
MPAPCGANDRRAGARTRHELVPDRKEPHDVRSDIHAPTVNPGSERPERLLAVAQAASVLGTTERFPRRLIEERRIRFTQIGRHVRIPESALLEFIQAGTVEPLMPARRRRKAA